MAEADPRDRAFSRWLNETEKVVFSSASGPTDWANTRFVDERPAAAVDRLRAQPGGDILVLASRTVIRSLLADDHVDRLSITLCPEISGGGDRLFEDGLPATSWALTSSVPTTSGALCLRYDRLRQLTRVRPAEPADVAATWQSPGRVSDDLRAAGRSGVRRRRAGAVPGAGGRRR